MKKETLYKAIGQIDDDIVHLAAVSAKIPRKKSWLKYAVAAACVCLVAAASIVMISTLLNNRTDPINLDSQEYGAVKDPTIIFEDKHYVPLSDNLMKAYGFETAVTQNQIGDKLGNVSGGNDKGKEVYAYIPADCEAVILMKNDGTYELYAFSAFKSYVDNQDEDMIEYLKMYGIHEFSDIKKITINDKVLTTDEAKTFYDFFSALKNSSDAYFGSLANYMDSSTDSSTEITQNNDYKTNMPTVSETFSPSEVNEGSDTVQSGSIEGSSGTNALEKSHSIKIYAVNGLFFEMPYYPNIQFISRHKVEYDFQVFLENYLK